MGSGWRALSCNQTPSIKLDVLHLDLRPPSVLIA
jgi:hypothetical protein